MVVDVIDTLENCIVVETLPHSKSVKMCQGCECSKTVRNNFEFNLHFTDWTSNDNNNNNNDNANSNINNKDCFLI